MKYIFLLLLLIVIIILRICSIETFENTRTVYIVSNIPGGGAVKYLTDITKHYTNNTYIYVKSKNDLNKINFNKNDILFIQHIIDTDISIDDLISIDKTNCKIYLSIHDCQWLLGINNYNNVASSYLFSDNDIMNSPNYEKLKILLASVDAIIHPSQFTYDMYSKYYSNKNFMKVLHNDYYINHNSKYIPPITNKTINIGHLSAFDEYKGREYILDLMDKYKTYNGYTINFIIANHNSPSYNEVEYYDYIKKYNIHGLTYLNKWGETWCYSLTKGLNTGLPIIYNNIGAFKERIYEKNKEQYFKAFDNEYDDIKKIYDSFEKMLDYIIKNNGKYNNFYKNSEIIYDPFYDNLFG